MPNDLNNVLHGTIAGLSMLDVQKLESHCAEAEALLGNSHVASQPNAETAALRNTLRELLDSTDANLRLLRELRALRARGRRNLDDTGFEVGSRWAR